MNEPTSPIRPSLSLDGAAQPALEAALLSLRIDHVESHPSCLHASFTNWGPVGGERGVLWFELLSIGKRVSIALDPSEPTLFDGRIAAIGSTYPGEGPPTIEVIAEDALAALRGSARVRVFENMTEADVLRALAAEAALDADIDLSGPVHAALVQMNETDLALAQRCAADCGGAMWAEGHKLIARGAGEPARRLSYGSSLRAFRVLADARSQVTSLSVNGWDRVTKRAILEFGKLQDTGGGSGPHIVAEQFGTRSAQVLERSPATPTEARAWADAALNTRARSFVRGWGATRDAITLRAGDSVELSGLGASFDGRYRLRRVQATFDATHGFANAFEVERPKLGDQT